MAFWRKIPPARDILSGEAERQARTTFRQSSVLLEAAGLGTKGVDSSDPPPAYEAPPVAPKSSPEGDRFANVVIQAQIHAREQQAATAATGGPVASTAVQLTEEPSEVEDPFAPISEQRAFPRPSPPLPIPAPPRKPILQPPPPPSMPPRSDGTAPLPTNAPTLLPLAQAPSQSTLVVASKATPKIARNPIFIEPPAPPLQTILPAPIPPPPPSHVLQSLSKGHSKRSLPPVASAPVECHAPPLQNPSRHHRAPLKPVAVPISTPAAPQQFYSPPPPPPPLPPAPIHAPLYPPRPPPPQRQIYSAPSVPTRPPLSAYTLSPPQPAPRRVSFSTMPAVAEFDYDDDPPASIPRYHHVPPSAVHQGRGFAYESQYGAAEDDEDEDAESDEESRVSSFVPPRPATPQPRGRSYPPESDSDEDGSTASGERSSEGSEDVEYSPSTVSLNRYPTPLARPPPPTRHNRIPPTCHDYIDDQESEVFHQALREPSAMQAYRRVVDEHELYGAPASMVSTSLSTEEEHDYEYEGENAYHLGRNGSYAARDAPRLVYAPTAPSAPEEYSPEEEEEASQISFSHPQQHPQQYQQQQQHQYPHSYQAYQPPPHPQSQYATPSPPPDLPPPPPPPRHHLPSSGSSTHQNIDHVQSYPSLPSMQTVTRTTPPQISIPRRERAGSLLPRSFLGVSLSRDAKPSRTPSPNTARQPPPLLVDRNRMDPRSFGMTGLDNLGNSCYMASVIQLLAGTSELTNFFLSGEYKKEVNKKNSFGTKGQLAEALAKLLLAMRSEAKPSLSPSGFRDAFCKYKSQFKGHGQHDAQEFLTYLLDGLHEDLNLIKGKVAPLDNSPEREAWLESLPEVQGADTEWQDYRERNDSIIIDLFSGQFPNRMECLFCHQTSTTYNAFSSLGLPVPNTRSTVNLHQCLNEFLREEILEGENAWNCPRCRRPRSTSKRLSLARLPDFLIIHLKRFASYGDISAKIETEVLVPLERLDLRKYLPPIVPGLPLNIPQQEDATYELYGICNHYADGSSGGLSSGHYTALVRNSEEWFDIGDDVIRLASQTDVFSATRSAYLLFYQLAKD